MSSETIVVSSTDLPNVGKLNLGSQIGTDVSSMAGPLALTLDHTVLAKGLDGNNRKAKEPLTHIENSLWRLTIG